jgi:tRNA threonylcarbamoyl adenosine modification protein YeaZ
MWWFRLNHVLLLVLDTATPAITAALAEVTEAGERVLAQRVTINARAHGELLAPQINEVLAEAGVRPRELHAIAAGVGPGPYTGLRAGLVTAATMSMALGIPAYGVTTLDAIGAATSEDHVLVATDARRREVYYAIYSRGLAGTKPAVEKPADLAPRLAALGVTTGVGEGVQRYAGVLGVSSGEPLYPPASQLARLAAARVLAKEPAEPLTPLYLRRPDAVEPARAGAR